MQQQVQSSAPDIMSARSVPDDQLLENFRQKQILYNQTDKLRLSNDASQQSIISQSEDEEPAIGFKNRVWREKALNIIVIVARFVTYVLTNSEKFKLRYLEPRQFKIIGDKSANYDYFLDTGLIRSSKQRRSCHYLKSKVRLMLNLLKQLSVYVQPIKPDNTYKILWDMVVFTILLINIIYIPMKISFELDQVPDGADFFLDTLPQYIFLAEIILNFNVAYYSRGVLVLNHTLIVKHYLRGKFLVDFIVLIPFLFGRNSVPYLEFVLLFRVSRVMLIFENLVEYFNLRVNFAALIDIISLLSMFLFASHLIACMWHFIGMQETISGATTTWISEKNMQFEGWLQRYLTSFYWACITTLTIGYGDIVPVTSIEQLFVIFVTLCSSIIFGYTISSIGSIFAQISEQKKYQRDKITMIDQFIKSRGLNKELQVKVKKFFEYYLKIETDKEGECKKLIEHLSCNLHKEVKIDFYKKLILQSRLFRQNFSHDFVEKLCILVQEKQFVPEEIISQEGQKVDKIYFILKGEVEAFISKNKIVKAFYKGQSINDKYFISQHPALYSTRATKFSKLAYINLNDLLQLLEQNQEDREHFFHVKHQIEFRGKVKFQGCELCYQNHDFIRCPFVFYTPNPYKNLKKQALIENQSRLYKLRDNQSRRMHSINQRREITYCAVAFGSQQGFFQELAPNHEFFLSNQIPISKDSLYQESVYESSQQIISDKKIPIDDMLDSCNLRMDQSIEKRNKQTILRLPARLSQQFATPLAIEQIQINNPLVMEQISPPKLQLNKQISVKQLFKQNTVKSVKQTITNTESEKHTQSNSMVSFQGDQIKEIEIAIAKDIAQTECNIDRMTEMLYYDVEFNFNLVLLKIEWTKKRKIKLQHVRKRSKQQSRNILSSKQLEKKVKFS